MDNDNVLINLLKKELLSDLQNPINEKELWLRVQERVSELIEHDFEKLVNLLYRVDVNEQKLKQLLQSNPDKDAAAIITTLIIERQMEKIKSRQHIQQPDNPYDTEEKW
ncbi:MAG: hypothetical protein M9904_07015 [Chitinophagaceae bacterium]|nr:hypothetical protein [Chitinophagaceae bacterium]